MNPQFLAALLTLALAGMAHAAEPEVAVSLRFPEAETWVLGDDIPLYWHFENRSSAPLAFMWEACCRQNGRMDVTQDGQPVDTVPPVTALAHMFARAETLPPSGLREFETLLSDWAVLPGTGRYTLAGTYTGVTTNQQPVVPRGLPLWRGTAATPPAKIAVLGVEDYLRQRQDRSARRGLELALSGPAALTPLGTNVWRLEIHNRIGQPQALTWPGDFAFWVVDADGRRIARGAVLDAPVEPVTVPAQGAWTREFTLSTDRFEREPLGDHRAFVDLAAAGPDQPRVPSNVLPLAWRLLPATVADLLHRAAEGAAAGGRNPALRLLRAYLLELAPTLARLDPAELGDPARELGERLRRASLLKPASPRPGLTLLAVHFDASGQAAWSDANLATNLPPLHPPRAAAFADLLALRRDLGWDLSLRLEPAPDTRLADLVRFAAAVPPAEAGGRPLPVFAHLDGGTNRATRVQFNVPSGGVPVVDLTGGSAATPPAGNAPLAGPAQVRAPGDLTWRELARRLAGVESPAGFTLEAVTRPAD